MSNAEGAGMNMTESNSAVRKIFLSHSEQILGEMLDKANILTFIYYPKEQRYEGLKLPKGFGVAPELLRSLRWFPCMSFFSGRLLKP